MNNKAIAPETTVQERCAICGRPRIYKYDGYCRPICERCANGGGSCALFADEDDEGQGWCELHQESVCYADKCANRISKV